MILAPAARETAGWDHRMSLPSRQHDVCSLTGGKQVSFRRSSGVAAVGSQPIIAAKGKRSPPRSWARHTEWGMRCSAHVESPLTQPRRCSVAHRLG